MTNIDLIQQCFYALNGFKRQRALEQIKKEEGKSLDAQYHELKQYQLIDNLELGLRALQRGLYEERNKGEEINVEHIKEGDSESTELG